MKLILNPGLPPKIGIEKFTKKITVSLFPVTAGGISYPRSVLSLKIRLYFLLRPLKKRLPESPRKLVKEFFRSLPEVKRSLEADAESIAFNDPAASCTEEVMMTYPGFFAIMVYRLANRLSRLGIPLIPRIMTESAHSRTGIDIHPGATIGTPFFIDHGTGIVIGETSEIGDRVKIYQGVTIGALSVDHSMAGKKRHPTICNDVIIYAGSTILGGETVVGEHSIIGGNVWLTSSVPPYSLVYHQNTVKVRERNK